MLDKVDLFADFPQEAIESLMRFAKTHKYPRNAVILTEGDECNNFYVIKSGKVKVYVDDEDDGGKQIVLNILEGGSYFGELGLIDGEPRSASVMTMDKTELLAISPADFRQFLDQNHPVAVIMMRALVKRIRTLTNSVRDLALLDVYSRVSNLLKNRADENGDVLPKLTHQEIADMVGASREMVSRIMRELALGGFIEQNPSQLKVLKTLPKGW